MRSLNFLSLSNPSSYTMALGLTQPVKDIENVCEE
jgi:hypothetical protein